MLYFYGLSIAKMCRYRQIYAYLFLKNFKIRCKVLEMMSDIICVRKKNATFLREMLHFYLAEPIYDMKHIKENNRKGVFNGNNTANQKQK